MIFWSFWPLPDHQNIPLGQRLATSPKACAVIRICTTRSPASQTATVATDQRIKSDGWRAPAEQRGPP